MSKLVSKFIGISFAIFGINLKKKNFLNIPVLQILENLIISQSKNNEQMSKFYLKKQFTALFLSLFFSINFYTSYSQTITYNVNLGTGTCAVAGSNSIVPITFTLDGMQNGKNYYSLKVVGQVISFILWNGTIWQIQIAGLGTQFVNSAPTLLNPPCFGVGNFVNVGANCSDAFIVSSSGNCETSAIPVELVDFKAKINSNSIELNWLTASEVNNKGFEINRSEDGIHFNALDFVKSKGDSKTFIQYKLSDKTAFTGVNYYYLLKQIDNDGKEKMSKIISIKAPEKKSFSVAPNPANTDITIKSHGEMTQFLMFDLLGKLVLKQTFSGTNNVELIDISTLQKGHYIVEMVTNKGIFRAPIIKM